MTYTVSVVATVKVTVDCDLTYEPLPEVVTELTVGEVVSITIAVLPPKLELDEVNGRVAFASLPAASLIVEDTRPRDVVAV